MTKMIPNIHTSMYLAYLGIPVFRYATRCLGALRYLSLESLEGFSPLQETWGKVVITCCGNSKAIYLLTTVGVCNQTTRVSVCTRYPYPRLDIRIKA